VKQIIEKEKIEKWGFGSINWLLIGWRQISMRACNNKLIGKILHTSVERNLLFQSPNYCIAY